MFPFQGEPGFQTTQPGSLIHELAHAVLGNPGCKKVPAHDKLTC